MHYLLRILIENDQLEAFHREQLPTILVCEQAKIDLFPNRRIELSLRLILRQGATIQHELPDRLAKIAHLRCADKTLDLDGDVARSSVGDDQPPLRESALCPRTNFIFCETGLVVTPFLPGDSPIFAIGALSAKGALNIYTVAVLLMLAAIIGDSTNYWIGYFVGPKVFHSESSRWLNHGRLERTNAFYEKYCVKTVIIASFMPIVRTFAPFVAGIGRMYYPRFLFFNVLGSILRIGLIIAAGYLFGNIPVVKNNFTLVVLAIIFISILPAVIEVAREKFGRKLAVIRARSKGAAD